MAYGERRCVRNMVADVGAVPSPETRRDRKSRQREDDQAGGRRRVKNVGSLLD